MQNFLPLISLMEAISTKGRSTRRLTEVSQDVTRVMQAIAAAEETDEAEVIAAETSEEDEAEMLGICLRRRVSS